MQHRLRLLKASLSIAPIKCIFAMLQALRRTWTLSSSLPHPYVEKHSSYCIQGSYPAHHIAGASWGDWRPARRPWIDLVRAPRARCAPRQPETRAAAAAHVHDPKCHAPLCSNTGCPGTCTKHSPLGSRFGSAAVLVANLVVAPTGLQNVLVCGWWGEASRKQCILCVSCLRSMRQRI